MFLSSSAIPAYTPTRSISQISTDQRQLEEGAFHSLFSIHNETLDDASEVRVASGLTQSSLPSAVGTISFFLT